jgi:hypothetical protein
MASATRINQEYKTVCAAMAQLCEKGGRSDRTPLPGDEDLYCRLAVVKETLEWVHPKLIKTTAKGAARFNELMGYRHYAMGPTHAVLYP